MTLIDSQLSEIEEVTTDTCDRCGGLDESNGGTANLVDGKSGLCAVCASDMGLI